MSLIRN